MGNDRQANVSTVLNETTISSGTHRQLAFIDVIALYPEEWILMRVTEHDDEGWSSRGHVLAHSISRDAISVVLEREPAPADIPPETRHQPCYVFRAYPRTSDPNDPRYVEAVEQFIGQFNVAKDAPRARGRG